MKKIFLVALLAIFSWQAEAQINNLTIEEAKSQTENMPKFIEQDLNLLKEHVPNISSASLNESRNLLKTKYEKLFLHHEDIPQEKIESFCHSLTERFKVLLGEDFEKVAKDPRVIRQLSGLSLFTKRGN